MPRLSEKKIASRDVGRDLEKELKESLKLLKSGHIGRVTVSGKDGKYIESEVARVRFQLKMSQSQFAKMMGISKRTLQDWEQGRRKPAGPALSLLKIAEKRPDILLDLFC
jgi:putative transcriptional regulator